MFNLDDDKSTAPVINRFHIHSVKSAIDDTWFTKAGIPAKRADGVYNDVEQLINQLVNIIYTGLTAPVKTGQLTLILSPFSNSALSFCNAMGATPRDLLNSNYPGIIINANPHCAIMEMRWEGTT